jgi:hypothetical protein
LADDDETFSLMDNSTSGALIPDVPFEKIFIALI